MAVTTEELNSLAEEIARLRSKESELSNEKKLITQELELQERAMLTLLQESNLKNYRAPSGLASISFRTSVKTPKTPEDKAKFYDYLKSVDLYEVMISVNSQTLNSFYREQLELAKQQGKDDFEIPGITEVTITPNLSFTRPK